MAGERAGDLSPGTERPAGERLDVGLGRDREQGIVGLDGAARQRGDGRRRGRVGEVPDDLLCGERSGGNLEPCAFDRRGGVGLEVARARRAQYASGLGGGHVRTEVVREAAECGLRRVG